MASYRVRKLDAELIDSSNIFIDLGVSLAQAPGAQPQMLNGFAKLSVTVFGQHVSTFRWPVLGDRSAVIEQSPCVQKQRAEIDYHSLNGNFGLTLKYGCACTQS